MSEKTKLFSMRAENTVITYTLVIGFAVLAVMGLVFMSGFVSKSYEGYAVADYVHESNVFEKEVQGIQRMSYSQQAVNESNLSTTFDKTERAEEFDRKVRSDDYWASLQNSMKDENLLPGSTPIVIPRVVIGSAK